MKKYIPLLLFALLLGDCSSVPVTGRRQLNLVSDSDVISSSFQQYETYIKSAPISADKNATAMVVRVGKNIASAVERYFNERGMSSQLDGYKWEFNLVKDATPNAFCMPGGKIVVYEGILPYTQDDAGLAVVLGHEVAHAVAKHSNERMSQQMLVSAGGQAVGVATNNMSAMMQSAIGALYGLGTQYGAILPFSRTHEMEADHMGLIFMAMAGYDPNKAINFWQRMSQSGGQKPPEFMSTHPSDDTRITKIQSWMPEAMQYYKSTGNKGNTPNTPKNTNTNNQWSF
jgi:predicted Zn-dependent protease